MRRPRALEIRALLIASAMLAGGCAGVGIGLSDIEHAHQISAHGVAVTSTVIQNNGRSDRYAVTVGYQTTAGAQEQGSLDTPNQSTSYAIGSTLAVVYDPSDPSVVTLPGNGSFSGWLTLGAGAFLLALLAFLLLRSRRRGQRQS